ncbi:MAG TPA: protein-L-isoaspartate(D-aspartate) O-methyltransferase [bacterium]|nr:protein-L-isoaspartate(D-aspartate) O-methyltransferase [bacterium]HOL47731.1 protein-L-isoaspartate(D-aspartate) O-methyltransferase [bacterium]HPQ18035.1 protein-L-isoaspartate(D-aspartate) O-methyltransferase [bacterium]
MFFDNTTNNNIFETQRKKMVKEQIIARGIKDERVIEAMLKIPREIFVPEALREKSYYDGPLPIGNNQTISQPYIVALMTELLKLKGKENVLEIGTGSGYQTAILSLLAEKIVSIERIKQLHDNAKKILLDFLNLQNIILLWADGTVGTSQYGFFDRILITAGAPEVPTTLLNLLNEDGILVAPVGGRYSQVLEIYIKKRNKFIKETNIPVAFVPLIGKYGWNE